MPLSEAAAPTPRAFEHVPPAELERREALKLEARSAEAWRRGERAEGVDPRTIDNAAVSPTIKNLIAAGSRREREADLPKGAGPAGRHEPTTRVDERRPSRASGRFRFANVARAEGRRPPREAKRRAGASPAEPPAANALLGRCRMGGPSSRRAQPDVGGVVGSVTKVPRAARRRSTRCGGGAGSRGGGAGVRRDAFAAMDARWLRPGRKPGDARSPPGSGRGARVRGRGERRGGRWLAATVRAKPPPGETPRRGRRADAAKPSGNLPDELSVVPRDAARGRGLPRPARTKPRWRSRRRSSAKGSS